ncbi:MAG: ABC transporter substrate-binding protein [Gemmatimonadota bacterium]|nr:ABC transporter substrate-binding protein [Gemmatimonadota bacterium]
MQKNLLYVLPVLVLISLLAFFLWPENLSNRIIFPYISHQKPILDPHLPAADGLSDKLDEAVFDGLFNLVATPSGIAYEDGLGEYVGTDDNMVVTIRLRTDVLWHSSYNVSFDGSEVAISDASPVPFVVEDLAFTLRRIQRLGSLSRDHIIVAQALESFDFEGPDENSQIRFSFNRDRNWQEDEIKEILSFKMLPKDSEIDAAAHTIGTGPYMLTPPNEEKQDTIEYYKNPVGLANISSVLLQPFIDNSTFTTELQNARFNVLLGTPFGALSPILEDSTQYFTKSNISTTFFALLFNTQRVSRKQRKAIRQFISNKTLMERLYKVNTEQQRHILDYKGNRDNYEDYFNHSVFPTSSYYVDEQIVMPQKVQGEPDLAALPDTVRIVASVNFGYREEYNELVEALNDEGLFFGKVKATIIQSADIRNGNYDAILVAFTGYKSNFLFDLYDVFMREPDLAMYKINVRIKMNEDGTETVDPASWQANNNFFRLEAAADSPEKEDINKLLEYIHGFMSTREIGDKQAYAQFVDEVEREMALGVWLFSMPSLAYFSAQFDADSINMYGVASQLSTVEKWRERIAE